MAMSVISEGGPQYFFSVRAIIIEVASLKNYLTTMHSALD
jgi:hypothetical protein